MTVKVTFTDDPARVLREAEEFLAADPVRNNVMYSLLSSRIASPEEGRYWVATCNGEVCGVVFNSPLAYPPLEICADREVVESVVKFIAESRLELPGVSGAVETAAVFAGQWTEVRNCAAVPTRGTRLYEAKEVLIPVARGEAEGESDLSLTLALSHKGEGTKPGHFRPAGSSDRQILVDGLGALSANSPVPEDGESAYARRRKSQDFWVWEVDGKAVSMAATNKLARQGVVPVNAVYTPEELRGRGYATACVVALTQKILDDGDRAVLYTNLANPTSNSIYRRIGYRAVEESISYRFEG